MIDVIDEVGSFEFTLDASLMAQADRISIKLDRLGTDGLDTFTGKIGIMESVRFNFNRA